MKLNANHQRTPSAVNVAPLCKVESLAGRVYNAGRGAWNSSRPRTKLAVISVPLTAVAISVFAASLALPTQTWADNDDEISTFTVDVSLTPVFKQNDVDPSEGQNAASPGDTFFQEGTIYPAGTIQSGKPNNDPNAPGGIGKYLSRGVFTQGVEDFERAANGLPGARPDEGFVTEIYSFHERGTSIMTDGIWPNPTFSARRVVLGGTGQFRDIVGEIKEENLGENVYGFCNFRATFLVKRVKAEKH
jgi:hypothetical protein